VIAESRLSVRRSAPLGLTLGLVWLTGVFTSSVLVARFSTEDYASWHDALTRSAFAFFGWGWFLTFAIVVGVNIAGCGLLQWSRPRSQWLPWALPLIAVVLTVLLDAATRLLDNTQWVTAEGAAEAARTANVASLASLVIIAATAWFIGSTLRRRDRHFQDPEPRLVRLTIVERDAPERSTSTAHNCSCSRATPPERRRCRLMFYAKCTQCTDTS
jgi:hypothetical protein